MHEMVQASIETTGDLLRETQSELSPVWPAAWTCQRGLQGEHSVLLQEHSGEEKLEAGWGWCALAWWFPDMLPSSQGLALGRALSCHEPSSVANTCLLQAPHLLFLTVEETEA